jgi:hypothetical protein
MISMNSKEDLLRQLKVTIDDALSKARLNYRLSYFCYIVAFLGGATGSVIVALDDNGSYRILAAIAGLLPTLSLSALTTFKLSARADWHYDRVRELRKVLRYLLIAEDVDVKKLVDWWNKTEDALDKRWPKFGILPHADTEERKG